MIVYNRLWDTMKKQGISQYKLIKDYKRNLAKVHSFDSNILSGGFGLKGSKGIKK